MKVKSIILVLILLASCSKSPEGIEILGGIDSRFPALKSIQPNGFAFVSEDMGKLIKQDLQNAVNSIVTDETTINGQYIIFVGEDGKIAKVLVQNDEAKLIDKLIKPMENWQMGIVQKDSGNTSYMFDWNFAFNKNAEGKFALVTSTIPLINEINGVEYYNIAEKMPEPIGGIVEIQNKIVYPEIAKRAGIQGRIFVKALIDTSGNVAYSEIIKGIGAGCDEVAIEAVKSTKFTPGMLKGKPVNVQVVVPILFKLQ